MNTKLLLRKALIAALLTPFVSVSAVHADDDTFISLTRRPTKRSQLPTNAAVITAEEMKKVGAKSVADALDLIASAKVTRTGSLGTFSDLRLRSVPSAAQTHVVIDDQPLGGVSHQFIDLAQIPIENIERIEVVRGGSSVLYGANTIGGVVHIITKKNVSAPPSMSAGFEAGSFQTKIVDASVGGSHNGWNAMATAEKYETGGFQENSDAVQTSFTGTGGYSFGNGARVAFDVANVKHDVGNPRGTTVPLSQWNGEKERSAADRTARVEQNKTESRLKGSVPMGRLGVVESVTFGSRQHYRTRPDGDDPADFDQTNTIMGNDTQLQFFNGTTVGAAYERDERHNVGSDRLHITNYAGYLEHDLVLSRLRVIPAVRVDHHSSFGSIANPRLTLVYALNDWWTISGNAARSYRAPSFLELFFKDPFFNGNPNLKPEKGWTYDLGSQFQLTDNYQLKITGYYSRISDRIAATSTTYENLNQAEILGAETELSGRCYHGNLGTITDSMSYAYQNARASSAGSTHSTRFRHLRLTPTHTIVGQLGWENAGWSLNNVVRYVSDIFEGDNYTGRRLPPYAVWNARLAKQIRSVELFTEVNNILDRRYASAFEFGALDPASPRTYWGGVNVRFQGASEN